MSIDASKKLNSCELVHSKSNAWTHIWKSYSAWPGMWHNTCGLFFQRNVPSWKWRMRWTLEIHRSKQPAIQRACICYNKCSEYSKSSSPSFFYWFQFFSMVAWKSWKTHWIRHYCIRNQAKFRLPLFSMLQTETETNLTFSFPVNFGS